MIVGDVMLMRGKGILSWLIRYFSKGNYSHCACYIGHGLCVESSFWGVQVNQTTKHEEYDVYYRPDATPEQLQDAVGWMLNRVGAGYDFMGFFGIFRSIVLRKKSNPWDDKSRYWCSELLADGYINAGINIEVEHDTWKVSPQGLADVLELRTVGGLEKKINKRG